jgi:hypothetical protein
VGVAPVGAHLARDRDGVRERARRERGEHRADLVAAPVEVPGRRERGPAVVEGDDAAEGGHGVRVGEVAAAQDLQRVLADAHGAETGVGLREQRRDRPGMVGEQPSVGVRERAQVPPPVLARRRRLEALQDAVQERVDELVLGGEVVVERHRRGTQSRGHGADGERAEAVAGELLGGVEDDVGPERAAPPPCAARRGGVRLAGVFGHRA